EQNPNAQSQWYTLALLRLRIGDAPGYRAACAALQSHATAASDPLAWERAARVRLLSPTPGGVETKSAIELAHRAAQKAGVDPAAPNPATTTTSPAFNAAAPSTWFLLTSGLADYRAGAYATAAATLDRTRPKFDIPLGRSATELCFAMAL